MSKCNLKCLYREVEWVLIDGMQGGSGIALDWSRLAPPIDRCTRGWVLAGGLTPGNVAMVRHAAHLGAKMLLITRICFMTGSGRA